MNTALVVLVTLLAAVLSACGGPAFSTIADKDADATEGAPPRGAHASDASAAPDTSTNDATADAPVGAGGAPTSTGGAPMTAAGGKLAAGGTSGCARVAHNNGAGQTWTDCVSTDTHTEAQAKKACEAWCSTEHCTCFSAQLCGTAMQIGQVGTGASTTMTGWAWETPNSGSVMKIDPLTQTRCDPIGSWD